MKRLPSDQSVCPNLRRCQIHSTNHQPPIHCYVMRTIFTSCVRVHILVACHVLWQGPKLHACYCKMLPKWAVDWEACLGQPRQFYSAPLTQYTHMLCKCFHVAEMAQSMQGKRCQDLCICTCQILPVFAFTPCPRVHQRPLHLVQQSRYHQRAFENYFQ
jgi:hypothetical protein